MEREVEIRFVYAEAEFAGAMRLYLADKVRPRVTGAIAVSSVLLAVVLLALGHHRGLSIAVIILGLVMGCMLLFTQFVLPRWNFRKEPSFSEEHRLVLRKSGLQYRTDEVPWDTYERGLRQNREVYVLVSDRNRLFTAIPKRAFENVEERLWFETLFSEDQT